LLRYFILRRNTSKVCVMSYLQNRDRNQTLAP
jgi:hypothetical protein